MQFRKLAFAGVSLVLLLPLLFSAGLGGTLAVAAHTDTASLCRRVFLPMVLSGAGGAASADVFSPSLAPVVPLAQSAACSGFPDFNGDGFADLAIGVPRKEVFDGVVNQVDAGIVQVIYGSRAGLNATAGQAILDDQNWHRALGGVSALAGDLYGRSLAMGDFNSDGYDDLAVGIPHAVIGGHNDAGAVQVIYGSATGLGITNIQEWSLDHDGLDGDAAENEDFGTALSVGDFDSDGYADLAIGAPYATVNGDAGAGAVHILYGRAAGLTGLGSEVLTQDTPGFLATSTEAGDNFGLSLVAGDFDGDGVDDLAVGAPYEDNGAAFVNAGAVQIFFGQTGNGPASAGLLRFGSVVDPQYWTADSPDVEGAMEPGEAFGLSLAAANFNGDAYDDLAIGIPLETHGSGAGAIAAGGAINVLHGSATGLAVTALNPARLWHQESSDVDDEVDTNELFGLSLAAADFDNDGYADLAIGVPGETTFGVTTGAAHVMYGTSIGLTQFNDELIYDAVNPNADDAFGWAITAGDYDGDGYADLAVGAFGDKPQGVGADHPGSVFVFYSDSDGASQVNNQNWYPGYAGLKGTPVTNDNFGSAMPGSPDRLD